MRPEHLEGMLRRLAANETILKVIITEELLDIIHDCLEPKLALKIEAISISLNEDKGEYVFADFRNAVNEAVAEIKQEELPERIKWRLRVCLDYLFPPPRPQK